MSSIRNKGQNHHHHHHPGTLKRGRKGKTTSNLEAGDDGGDSHTSGGATRPGSTGIMKHSRHGRSEGAGNWTNVTKAAKEPAYKGPWVSQREEVNRVDVQPVRALNIRWETHAHSSIGAVD